MALGSNPFSHAPEQDGKWGDIGGIMDLGPIPPLTNDQKHDAQHTVVELMGFEYGKGESMKFLEMLGIDRKVKKDGDSTDC